MCKSAFLMERMNTCVCVSVCLCAHLVIGYGRCLRPASKLSNPDAVGGCDPRAYILRFEEMVICNNQMIVETDEVKDNFSWCKLQLIQCRLCDPRPLLTYDLSLPGETLPRAPPAPSQPKPNLPGLYQPGT